MSKNNSEAPKKGDTVNIVLADGKPVSATVTAVRKGGLVDVEFEHKGQAVEITASPCDPSCKLADSWHWPEASMPGLPAAAESGASA